MMTIPVRQLSMTHSAVVLAHQPLQFYLMRALRVIAAVCGSVRNAANLGQKWPIAHVKAAIALCRHYRDYSQRPQLGHADLEVRWVLPHVMSMRGEAAQHRASVCTKI